MPYTGEELQNILANLEANTQRALLRKSDLDANLPTWSQVSAAVDNISNLAEAKAFLKKLSRVVYWLARDSGD
jgi:hypothetical protein